MASGPGVTIAIAEKRFAGSEAPLFVDFRLEVAPGSVLALQGPSGVGKSTLLRTIGGIDRDFTGSVMVDGVHVHEAPSAGFVFQDPRLLPWLTARDNVRAADPAMSEAAAGAMLVRVGLGARANAYPHALSGGMQRRVAIARALAANSGFLLLDEPFVSLDGDLISEMHQVLRELVTQSGATVIFASHHASDAARLADRVIRLQGRPVQLSDGVLE